MKNIQLVNSPLGIGVSDIFRKQFQNFIFKKLPFNLDFNILCMKERDSLEDNKKFVNYFLLKWIPTLYGIDDQSESYRNACLCELIRWSIFFNVPINLRSAKNHWYWTPESKGYIPHDVRVIAGCADFILTIMRIFGFLPKYNVQIIPTKVNRSFNEN